MSSNQFVFCPNVYTFFYNLHTRDIEKKYIIIEGFHEYLPIWHKYYDEYTMLNFTHVGSVEVHNDKIIKVLTRIDGGYSDDEVDYYADMFSNIESENENGIKSEIPNILKLMFNKMDLCKDILKDTIFTEEDLNKEKYCESYYDYEYGYEY